MASNAKTTKKSSVKKASPKKSASKPAKKAATKKAPVGKKSPAKKAAVKKAPAKKTATKASPAKKASPAVEKHSDPIDWLNEIVIEQLSEAVPVEGAHESKSIPVKKGLLQKFFSKFSS